jgi:hypothetical protein
VIDRAMRSARSGSAAATAVAMLASDLTFGLGSVIDRAMRSVRREG